MEDRRVFLSNLPASVGEHRFACAVILASTAVFLVIVPFAKVPLGALPAFIAIYQSALIINDLITAVFLFGQGQFSRSSALLLLAGAYLFTALMSVAHALTFPGLFAPTGLLGAGPQTTAWLYMFWHGGFPLFVMVYATSRPEGLRSEQGRSNIIKQLALVIAAVLAATGLATLGQDFLPPIMDANHYTPALIVVVSGVWILNLGAVLALSRRRPYSKLDLWLIVAMSAWLFDIALSAVFNAGRYDVGFYAGRIYGLLAASLVLVVLLVENGKLYVELLSLHQSARDKAVELERLSTIDPLTGIANRRAFDVAIDQEWRRMMRHATALSLLMIDVDCFKRFNDTYGHVAGDQCLRAVAQSLARRARRAGEMAARYGGEEFAVLLPHSGVDDARRLAELMCRSVRELNIPHSGSAVAPQVTISVGVAGIADVPKFAAALSRDGVSAAVSASGATVLVEAADHALYQAKIAGRNRVAAAGTDDIGLAPTAASAVSPVTLADRVAG